MICLPSCSTRRHQENSQLDLQVDATNKVHEHVRYRKKTLEVRHRVGTIFQKWSISRTENDRPSEVEIIHPSTNLSSQDLPKGTQLFVVSTEELKFSIYSAAFDKRLDRGDIDNSRFRVGLQADTINEVHAFVQEPDVYVMCETVLRLRRATVAVPLQRHNPHTHTRTSVSLRRFKRAVAVLLALAAWRSLRLAARISEVFDCNASATFNRMADRSSLFHRQLRSWKSKTEDITDTVT